MPKYQPLFPHVPKSRIHDNWRTAISRTLPPAPLAWLYDHGLLKGRCLDFGSGRNCWYNMECFDPHWQPKMPQGLFDTITCIYVLNVVGIKDEEIIINDVRAKLKTNGIAYFAVRRDISISGSNTQRWSNPNLTKTHEEAGRFAIYLAQPELTNSLSGTVPSRET